MDIAKAIGVAQGLCYRYFPSKEALFDSAIEQYADVLVGQFAGYGKDKDKNRTLRQIIETLPATVEERDTKYYSVFHGAENKKFHDQLSLKVCEMCIRDRTVCGLFQSFKSAISPRSGSQIEDASIKLLLFSACAAMVEGIVPSSCPRTLSARSRQKFRMVFAPSCQSA